MHDEARQLAASIAAATIEITRLIASGEDPEYVEIDLLNRQIDRDVPRVATLEAEWPVELRAALRALCDAHAGPGKPYRRADDVAFERAVEDIALTLELPGAAQLRDVREPERVKMDEQCRSAVVSLRELASSLLDALEQHDLSGSRLAELALHLSLSRFMLDEDHPAFAAAFEASKSLVALGGSGDAEAPSSWVRLRDALRALRRALPPEPPTN